MCEYNNNYGNEHNHTFKKSNPFSWHRVPARELLRAATASFINQPMDETVNHTHTETQHKSASNTTTGTWKELRWAVKSQGRLQSDMTYWLHSLQMGPHPPHHLGKLKEEEFRKERKKRRKETNKKKIMMNQDRIVEWESTNQTWRRQETTSKTKKRQNRHKVDLRCG